MKTRNVHKIIFSYLGIEVSLLLDKGFFKLFIFLDSSIIKLEVKVGPKVLGQ